MTADYWLNSQFSIARFWGGCTINGSKFIVIGEAADLLLADFEDIYNEYGRYKLITALRYAERHNLQLTTENFAQMLADAQAEVTQSEK